jgi:hypothetical protein
LKLGKVAPATASLRRLQSPFHRPISLGPAIYYHHYQSAPARVLTYYVSPTDCVSRHSPESLTLRFQLRRSSGSSTQVSGRSRRVHKSPGCQAKINLSDMRKNWLLINLRTPAVPRSSALLHLMLQLTRGLGHNNAAALGVEMRLVQDSKSQRNCEAIDGPSI